jgi:AcrR family transcriptional regulator
MGTEERRARHKSELRAKILAAARELFAAEGVEKVSMRRIAERVEYTPKTLYLYFRNKGEILYHLCEESFRMLDVNTRPLEDSTRNPVELVRECLRTYVEYGLAHPHDYRIAFLSDSREYPYHAPDDLPPDSMMRTMHGRFQRLLARGVKSGVFRRLDVEMATHAVWAGVHGLIIALIFDPESPWIDREKFIEATIEMQIQGLKKHG